MAASTNEIKQKKGSFMSFYKPATITAAASTTATKHRYQLPESKPVIHEVDSNKNYISRSWLSRKPKAVVVRQEEVKHGSREKIFDETGGGGKAVGGNGGRGSREVVVEGRKSVSHVEANLASVIAFLQVKVLVSDMPNSMQVHAFRCARRTYDSLEKFSARHMAYNIKKEFDKVHGPAWHCIVGSSFGSFVTHSTGCFLYFSMEKLYVLLFKTKIQKAAE